MEEKLIAYIVDNWSIPKCEIDSAFNEFAEYHCPLSEANDCVIGNELEDFIESFVEYNNLPEDWFEKSRFNSSTDNLFWEISPKLQQI